MKSMRMKEFEQTVFVANYKVHSENESQELSYLN